MENLKWQWSDLNPGDRIRFSKQCEDLTITWEYSYKRGILEVTSVERRIGFEDLKIYHRPLGTYLRPFFILINNENGFPSGYPILHSLFDIVELAKD